MAYEGHEYTLSENTWLQACMHPEQGFYDVKKTKYGRINHNHVSQEPHVVESGFVAQIKGKINILTDLEILHLKNQSLWID